MPKFTVAPAGQPDWIADPQPGFGYKMGTGFGMLRGYAADEPVKGRRRYWWPSKAYQLTPFDISVAEAQRCRRYRLRWDFATGAPRVSLAAFTPLAVREGARPYTPGDPVPAGGVRFAVAGVAAMADCSFMWNHGLWVGTYRTDLRAACAAARAAVERWWGPHTEAVVGLGDDGFPIVAMVGVGRAAAEVYYSRVGEG